MTRKRVLVLILIAYLVLGVVYSLVTPILESSDEFKHYPFVQHVQTEHALPVLDADICTWPGPESCPWLQDGGQPPAYYVLMGALTAWIDTSDIHEVRWMNPHAFVGDPYTTCNKNLLIHIPERERFPWHGSALAIHVIRFLTVLIGAGTVIVTYLLACDLFPDQKWLALGATALTAFTPMFLFVNAAVNNDSLAALLGCSTLLVFVRMVRDGQRGPLSPWRYAGIGGLIGLFMLTKLSGLGALILGSFLLAWLSYRRRSLRPLLVGFPLILGVAALISGWWFLRNWRLYGDLTALNEFIEIQGRRPGIPSLGDWVDEFGSFRWTYWGLFGAVNVMAPRWIYTFFDALSLVAIVGLGVWLVRSRGGSESNSGKLWWIPTLWIGVLFVSVLRWTWIYFSFQGRLIFPAIAGVNTLAMVGLREWVPSRWHRELTLALSGLFFVIAAALPFVSILPAYERPEPMTLAEVPLEARVEPVDMDGVARVVGWEMAPQTVPEGEDVEFVVYWESVAPDGNDYLSFARLLGREHELVGEVNRYPASGMVPTSLWEPGQVWRDRYRVEVAEGARAPTRLRVEVGLYDAETGRTLGVAQVGEAKLPPPEDCPAAPQPLEVDLADGVTLTGFGMEPQSVRAGETVTLTLYWETRSAPSRDYTVFVHLLDRSGEPVHFGDAPPLEGDYPTGMWAAGECVVDPHPLTLPADLSPDEYDLLVGMYNRDTMVRLQRLDGAGDSVEIPIPVEVR